MKQKEKRKAKPFTK